MDGDKYFVSWDPDLIPSSTHRPTSYMGAKSKPVTVTDESLVKFFAFYNTSLVGTINNLWCKWADQEGVLSPKCLLLANLFSRAVDAAKTGESLEIPCELRHPPQKQETDLNKRFVWEVMSLNARSYLKAAINDSSDFELISDQTLLDLIQHKHLLVDDYQLFRSLYKYLFNNNKKNLFYNLLEFINFDYFNRRQLESVLVDCPGLNEEFLFNSLIRSKILPRKFAGGIRADTFLNWSLYYTSKHTINWYVLNNFMQLQCSKLLVFEFELSSRKTVVALFLDYNLSTGLCTESNAKATAYMCVGNSVEMYRRLIGGQFTWLLNQNRLQLFVETQSRTFINFMEDENGDLASIMSVALEYFDTGLPRRSPRLRREKCLRVEFFSDIATREPFYAQTSTAAIDSETDSIEPAKKIEPFVLEAEQYPGKFLTLLN